MSCRYLHIIYIFEIILTNHFIQVHEKTLYIKFLIFILFLTFTLLFHFAEYQTHVFKEKYKRIITKYETLFDKYVYTLNNNVNLKKQIKDFDIPCHIKIQYIQHLISMKYKCPICLSIIKKDESSFLTICGHLFHENCINHDNNISDKCPSCRKYIIKNDLNDSDEIDDNNEDENILTPIQYIVIDN